jgi:hypothetical protein
MWFATLSAWWQAPLFGHGLGSFTDVFTPEFERLVANGHAIEYTPNLTHPHNELLLWLSETGLVGTALVIGPWLAWLLQRKPHAAWADQIGWLAVLIPIGLHCMTEYPLHGSGAHWFLLGLALAAPFEQLSPQPLTMPRTHWLAGLSGIVVSGLLTVLFLLHTGYLSFIMALHFEMALKEPKKYIEKMAASVEMHHPLLGQTARDTFFINTAPLLFELSDQDTIQSSCKQLIDLTRRYQNDANKEFLKRCQ